jgi:hypothetical protein
MQIGNYSFESGEIAVNVGQDGNTHRGLAVEVKKKPQSQQREWRFRRGVPRRNLCNLWLLCGFFKLILGAIPLWQAFRNLALLESVRWE